MKRPRGQSKSSSLRWFRSYPKYEFNGDNLWGPGIVCIDPVTGKAGIRYTSELIDTETGEILEQRPGCAVPRDPSTRPAVSDKPWTAPEDVWDVVPLPAPAWGLNPGLRGLTGLETYLWDPAGSEPVTATATIQGFTARAEARPTRWEWRMWENSDTPNVNPAPLVTATHPGSADDPAGRYMYETPGTYTVTMTVVWEGTYTLEGPGVFESQDLPPTTISTTRSYEVISVRGARVG